MKSVLTHNFDVTRSNLIADLEKPSVKYKCD